MVFLTANAGGGPSSDFVTTFALFLILRLPLHQSDLISTDTENNCILTHTDLLPVEHLAWSRAQLQFIST